MFIFILFVGNFERTVLRAAAKGSKLRVSDLNCSDIVQALQKQTSHSSPYFSYRMEANLYICIYKIRLLIIVRLFLRYVLNASKN